MTQVECQYCGTPQFVNPRVARRRSLLRQMLYSPRANSTSEVQINCICGKEYVLTLIGDQDYWINNIVATNVALDSAKRALHDDTITFDTIIHSMTGIAQFNNGDVHVCLIICNIRGYFDCVRVEKIFRLTTFWRSLP